MTIYISAHSPGRDIDMSSGITIRITEFPPRSTFRSGIYNGQYWILTSSDFGEVELSLPEHSSGTFEITAEALYANSSMGRMGTVQFTVQPVADAPILAVSHSPCIDSGSIVFTITSSLVDSDGSESLSVRVSGLPSGSLLSAGQVNAEGDYVLQADQLQTPITANLPVNYLNDVDVEFTATASEAFTDSIASTVINASIIQCAGGIFYIFEDHKSN